MTIKKLDFSALSQAECRALSIVKNNHDNSGSEYCYPYFCAALEALADEFTNLQNPSLNALMTLLDEVNAITAHLLALSPPPPADTPEEIAEVLSNDELINSLLQGSVVQSLARAFIYIQENLSMRIAELEKESYQGRLN